MNKQLTIPNLITILRILLIPVFIYLLVQEQPLARLWAILVFTLASVSDFVDGYLARRLKQDSRLGRFLDPLADKFLVVAALLVFYFLDKQIPLWMILVIIARDVLITFMRYLAIQKGTELKTSRTAKAKTAFQMISIFLILAVFFVRSYRVDIQETFAQGQAAGKKNITIATELFKEGMSFSQREHDENFSRKKVFAESLPYFLMYATALFTIFSGFRYIYFNYHVFLPPYHKNKTKQKENT